MNRDNLYNRLSEGIRYLYYSLFVMVPLAMNSKTSEIFEFNKMIVIYTLTTCIATLWAIRLSLKPEVKIVWTHLFYLFALFIASQTLSTVTSIDPHTSLYGYYGRWNGGLLSILAYSVLFFVFIQVFTKKTSETLLKISLGTSAFVLVWGLLAKIGIDFSCFVFAGSLENTCWTDQFRPSERMFSTIGQPNWMGAYLAIHFFLAWYFLLKQIDLTHVREKGIHILEKLHSGATFYLMAVYLILNALSIYFTRSRSALLAVAISIIFGSIIIFSRGVRRIIFLLIAFFFVAYAVNTVTFTFDDRVAQNAVVTDSFDIRKIVWQGAIDLGNRYPLFGSGPETFAYAYYFTRPLAHNATSEWDFLYNKAHNEFLNYYATTGSVGFLSYLGLIVGIIILFSASIKSKESSWDALIYEPSLYILLAFLTILTTNFFGFSVSSVQIFFYLFPALVIAFSHVEIETKRTQVRVSFMQMMILVIIAMCGVYPLLGIIDYYKADLHYTKARSYITKKEYGDAFKELNTASKRKYEHVYEDKMSNVLAYLAFELSFEDKEYALKLKDVSDKLNKKSIEANKQNILYWKTRAKNYYLYFQVTHDSQDLVTAIQALETAAAIAPTDAQTRYTLAVMSLTASDEVADTKLKDELKAKGYRNLDLTLKMRPGYIEAQELKESLK